MAMSGLSGPALLGYSLDTPAAYSTPGALLFVVLGLGFLPGCDPVTPNDGEPALDERWVAWQSEQDQALVDLGEPIVDCVQQEDTAWEVFHGCWDWHSAVHGVWALHAISRHLEEPSYREVAETLLQPDAVADELARIENGAPFGEVPYGYAWLLRLAVERAETGDDDLLPHGEEAARRLGNWVDAIPPSVTDEYALANDYDSSSWALLNLYEWAGFVGDTGLAEQVRDAARQGLLPAECPLEQEDDELGNFFPPCLHRALTLLRVLPAGERDAFLEDWIPDPPLLDPITSPGSPHAAGLNFSRAWGLWAVYEATGDARWRELWLDHVQTHLGQPEYWRDDYESHSHWIPQFGVLAISMSRE